MLGLFVALGTLSAIGYGLDSISKQVKEETRDKIRFEMLMELKKMNADKTPNEVDNTK